MKVIFIASGNKSVGTVSAFVTSQLDSLKREGIDVSLVPVVGHGTKAYLKTVRKVRNVIKQEKAEIVHAHYSICGLVASLAAFATPSKVVVSLLGSFPRKNFKRQWVRFFAKHIWDGTLVKSQRTADQLGLDLPVIPNGVNLEQFKIVDYHEAREACGFEAGKKYVIWCSNPARPEKRFELAKQAVEMLNDSSVVLCLVFNKTHDEVVKYMCAADVLLLTSISEGSPNVIKEAMSCNCPLVSTDVGDVKVRTNGLPGTYVAEIDSAECLSSHIHSALDFGQRTEGRARILSDGLTSEAVAQKIINQIYSPIIQ